MKLIIAGSRSIQIPPEKIALYLEQYKVTGITEIVSGGASGIDKCGESFAYSQDLPIALFYPDWDKLGRKAGPLRNKQMAEYGDALLLIWDGSSRGSQSMRSEMMKLGKPVYEIIIRG